MRRSIAGYRTRRNGSMATRYGRVSHDATDVDPPIQNVPVWAAHQSSADETVDGFVAGFTKRFSRKLVQDPKVYRPEYLALFRSRIGRVAKGVPKMSLP